MTGSAYYVEDGKCAYSFTSSTIQGTPGADAAADPLGFSLTYASTEKCSKGDGKFIYTLDMVCDSSATAAGTFTFVGAEDCSASA